MALAMVYMPCLVPPPCPLLFRDVAVSFHTRLVGPYGFGYLRKGQNTIIFFILVPLSRESLFSFALQRYLPLLLIPFYKTVAAEGTAPATLRLAASADVPSGKRPDHNIT